MRESLRKTTTLDGRLLCQGVPLSRSCRARARPNALNPMSVCVCVCAHRLRTSARKVQAHSRGGREGGASAFDDVRGHSRNRARSAFLRTGPSTNHEFGSIVQRDRRGRTARNLARISTHLTLEGGCTSKSTAPTTCVRTQPAQCHALRHLATHLHALTDRAGSNEADRPFCVLSSSSLAEHQPVFVRRQSV